MADPSKVNCDTRSRVLKHFADSFGPMPVMVTERTGIGIGTKTFDQANCIRVFLEKPGKRGTVRSRSWSVI